MHIWGCGTGWSSNIASRTAPFSRRKSLADLHFAHGKQFDRLSAHSLPAQSPPHALDVDEWNCIAAVIRKKKKKTKKKLTWLRCCTATASHTVWRTSAQVWQREAFHRSTRLILSVDSEKHTLQTPMNLPQAQWNTIKSLGWNKFSAVPLQLHTMVSKISIVLGLPYPCNSTWVTNPFIIVKGTVAFMESTGFTVF